MAMQNTQSHCMKAACGNMKAWRVVPWKMIDYYSKHQTNKILKLSQ